MAPRAYSLTEIGTKTFAASITAAAVAAATTPAAKAAAATAGATQRDVYWSIAGKGQSGRSGIDVGGADVASSRPDTEDSLYVSCDGSFDSRRCGSSGRNDAWETARWHPAGCSRHPQASTSS